MGAGPAIDPLKAAHAMNLADVGYSGAAISRITQLNQASVSDILNGKGHWSTLVEKPVFHELRRTQNQVLEAGFRASANLLLQRAFDESKLEKASTYQLVIASSVALDKARLLAGESTANVEVHSKVEVTGLDNLCSALSQVLLESTKVSQSQTTDSVTVTTP
jgi:hypothetical protein